MQYLASLNPLEFPYAVHYTIHTMPCIIRLTHCSYIIQVPSQCRHTTSRKLCGERMMRKPDPVNLNASTSGKRDSIHHHLLEAMYEATYMLELRQKLLYTTPSGWWWWCIGSVFRTSEASNSGILTREFLARTLAARTWARGQHLTPTSLPRPGRAACVSVWRLFGVWTYLYLKDIVELTCEKRLDVFVRYS